MIFRRGKKSRSDPEDDVAADLEDDATEDLDATADDATRTPDGDPATSDDELDFDTLDAAEWRESGPWDISEIPDPDDDADDADDADHGGPRIDLGSLILTGVPGSELRLQVSEETQEIVSAMLILETVVAAGDDGQPQAYSSALELGAYAAPRSGGLWSELRDEISESAVAAGGSASYGEGPFGVELRRLVPVTTPDGEEGYQPSRMWVAEGPRWLLRGIVYGQAAIEEDVESPVVADVLDAFRQIVVRRGDEAMAPGDLLPLSMPTDLVADDDQSS